MKDLYVRGKNLPAAYHKSLLVLNKFGSIVECNDYSTEFKKERTKEIGISILVENPLQEPIYSTLIIADQFSLEQYLQEIIYGILDFEKEWPYTYHSRIEQYHQSDFVINELNEDLRSRRAVIQVRDSIVDMNIEHPACLQHLQYLVRKDEKDGREKLNCIAYFRSNDAMQATYMNMYALIYLQKEILDRLNAFGHNISMGWYKHGAGSFHAYERSWKNLKTAAKRINEYNELIKKGKLSELENVLPIYLTTEEWFEYITREECQAKAAETVKIRKKANGIK